jgi:glycosyltransferase involved in cell wall biosynthesis
MNETVSVITICFNNLSELKDTCQSVDCQTELPDEHLIIDGSANQEILNWICSNPQPIYRRWIHERDNGIADAFNKGINNSKATITHLLNSGDRYYTSGAISIVKQHFQSDGSLMWAHSQYVQNRGGIDVITGASFDTSLLWKGMRTVAHPTMFIKKLLYNKHGLYNTNYKIAMDYDFLVRIRNEKFVFIPQPLVYFSPGGASNLQFKKGLAEVRKSYYNHFGKSLKLLVWQLRQQLLNAIMKTNFGETLFRLKNKKRLT